MELDELKDLASASAKYITLQLGEPVEFKIESIEKVEDQKFHIINTNYKVRITTDDQKIFDITSKKLLRMVNEVLQEANGTSGVVLNIVRISKGEYEVKLVSTPYESDEKVNTKKK